MNYFVSKGSRLGLIHHALDTSHDSTAIPAPNSPLGSPLVLVVIVGKADEAAGISVLGAIEAPTIITAVEDTTVRGSVESTTAARPIKIASAPIRKFGIVEPVVC